MSADIANRLRKLNTCFSSVAWADTLPEDVSPQQAYDLCERGDWLIWFNARFNGGEPLTEARKPIVLAACECVRLALPPTDAYVSRVMEVAEQWTRVEATESDIRDAEREAWRIPNSSAANSAAICAYVGTCQGYAYGAISYAANDDSRLLRECAIIVRKYFPAVPSTPEE
jgi:hypothetical protein